MILHTSVFELFELFFAGLLTKILNPVELFDLNRLVAGRDQYSRRERFNSSYFHLIIDHPSRWSISLQSNAFVLFHLIAFSLFPVFLHFHILQIKSSYASHRIASAVTPPSTHSLSLASCSDFQIKFIFIWLINIPLYVPMCTSFMEAISIIFPILLST